MATYPVIHKETGEQKEVVMSVTWSDPSTCPQPGEVGDWQNKLIRSKPGWNEVLDRASKSPGSTVKKIT